MGDYLYTDSFEMSGDGAQVHGWGNSLLKDRKTNKVRYFDRWNERKTFYQGKEVGFKGMEALMAYYLDKQQDDGLSNDEIINISIEKKEGRVLFDKKKELESEVFALNAKGLSNPNSSTISQSDENVKLEQRVYIDGGEAEVMLAMLKKKPLYSEAFIFNFSVYLSFCPPEPATMFHHHLDCVASPLLQIDLIDLSYLVLPQYPLN